MHGWQMMASEAAVLLPFWPRNMHFSDPNLMYFLSGVPTRAGIWRWGSAKRLWPSCASKGLTFLGVYSCRFQAERVFEVFGLLDCLRMAHGKLFWVECYECGQWVRPPARIHWLCLLRAPDWTGQLCWYSDRMRQSRLELELPFPHFSLFCLTCVFYMLFRNGASSGLQSRLRSARARDNFNESATVAWPFSCWWSPQRQCLKHHATHPFCTGRNSGTTEQGEGVRSAAFRNHMEGSGRNCPQAKISHKHQLIRTLSTLDNAHTSQVDLLLFSQGRATKKRGRIAKRCNRAKLVVWTFPSTCEPPWWTEFGQAVRF